MKVVELSLEWTPNKNEGVNEGVNAVLQFIINNPGCRVPAISETTKIPVKSVERYIKLLKSEGKIVFIGASKTGGYRMVE